MRALVWGAAFGAVAALGAALAVRDSAGEGWDLLPYAAGCSAFLLGTLLRRLAAASRERRHPGWRGAGVGALVAVLSHPLAWLFVGLYSAMLGPPSSLGDAPLGVADAVAASLVLSFGSLLLTGWWTVPIGAALGTLLVRLEPKPSPPDEATPSVSPAESSAGGGKPAVALLILFLLGLVLLLVGGFVYTPLYDLPAGLEWKSATGVFLVLLAASAFALRRRRHRFLLLALSCFGIVPTALALAVGARLTLNGLLDRAEPTHHTARVLAADSVRSSTGPGRPFKRIQVESWRAGDPDPWIEVHKRLYHEITPEASEVGVVTKPGWLGIEWMIEVHLELPEDPGVSSPQLVKPVIAIQGSWPPMSTRSNTIAPSQSLTVASWSLFPFRKSFTFILASPSSSSCTGSVLATTSLPHTRDAKTSKSHVVPSSHPGSMLCETRSPLTLSFRLPFDFSLASPFFSAHSYVPAGTPPMTGAVPSSVGLRRDRSSSPALTVSLQRPAEAAMTMADTMMLFTLHLSARPDHGLS